MVKKKYGIPMSSIGGGSLLSGIAQYANEVCERTHENILKQ